MEAASCGASQSGFPMVSSVGVDGAEELMEPASPPSEQPNDSGSKVYPHCSAVE